MSKFNIKYGRFYEVRNRFQLPSVHAWGTTAFRKVDVERAIAKYDEEQGKAQLEAYYTCFDIMQKYGILGQRIIRHQAIPEDVCRPCQCHLEAGGRLVCMAGRHFGQVLRRAKRPLDIPKGWCLLPQGRKKAERNADERFR